MQLFIDNKSSNGLGYRWLVETYSLRVLPNWHESSVANGSTRWTNESSGKVIDAYPPATCPEPKLGLQLEFALKNDGTNLEILAAVFRVIDPAELVAYIRSKPTGQYARHIWYLFEFLTGTRLAIDDLTQGNYVDLLDVDEYVTATPVFVQRQRVRNNLLGDVDFCPSVRRTQRLRGFFASDLSEQCRRLVASYPPETLRRALAYLYTKESKSSFEIEHIKPDAKRAERFVALLRLAESEDFFEKAKLIELQNRIVDERFRDDDYRAGEMFIGETVSAGFERVHYIAPRPGDLASLMNGLFASHARMTQSLTEAVVHAAVIAYGFVFVHPFDDGNGRIHRFLMHNILAIRGFTPPGTMFPVSAAMRKDLAGYDASLEAFSKSLMPLIDYRFDDRGNMTVSDDTVRHYRYPDLTPQAEALFAFIRETVEVEMVDELRFLARYDLTKAAVQDIVDMPDRLIDLFIKCCRQNHGNLPARKRADLFAMLSDDEIARLESAVNSAGADA